MMVLLMIREHTPLRSGALVPAVCQCNSPIVRLFFRGVTQIWGQPSHCNGQHSPRGWPVHNSQHLSPIQRVPLVRCGINRGNMMENAGIKLLSASMNLNVHDRVKIMTASNMLRRIPGFQTTSKDLQCYSSSYLKVYLALIAPLMADRQRFPLASFKYQSCARLQSFLLCGKDTGRPEGLQGTSNQCNES